jgi:hypothetical protein
MQVLANCTRASAMRPTTVIAFIVLLAALADFALIAARDRVGSPLR